MEEVVGRKRPPRSARVVTDIARAEIQAEAPPAKGSGPMPQLKRDESVIAAAVKAREGVIAAWGRRAGELGRELSAASSVARGSLAPYASKVVALPTGAKLALAATPLFLAGIVVAIAVLVTPSSEVAPTRIPATRTPVDPAPDPARAAIPVLPSPSSIAAASPTPSPASAVARLRAEAPPGKLEVTELTRTLPGRATLYSAPRRSSPKAAVLPAGAEVLLYTGLPAPSGWVVARRPQGELGFLRESALLERTEGPSAERPRKIDAEPRPRARAKARSSRALSADDLLR